VIASRAHPGAPTLRSAEKSERAYNAYWAGVGSDFPSLKGAASTAYYAECEQLLLAEMFPDLGGKSLFKTDLWDEAKNTEILRWAAERGARVAGVDIAPATVGEARRVLAGHRPRFAVADVRRLPHPDDAFDLVYSMGTVEHFEETEQALAEIHRVLRPGGLAVVGVPNRFDPFLRPLLVALLDRLGRYDYGREKCYSHRRFAAMLEAAGLRVRRHSGVLFLPGWLRMADLLLHTRGSRWARLTGALVRPFAALYRRVPALRRHGYLIALLAEKPANGAADQPAF
jgi:SAM-dependent methyltransferase